MSDTITTATEEDGHDYQPWSKGFHDADEMWRWMNKWKGLDVEIEAWPKNEGISRPARYRGRCLGPAHYERGTDMFVVDISSVGSPAALYVLALQNVRSVNAWTRSEIDGPGIDRDYAL